MPPPHLRAALAAALRRTASASSGGVAGASAPIVSSSALGAPPPPTQSAPLLASSSPPPRPHTPSVLPWGLARGMAAAVAGRAPRAPHDGPSSSGGSAALSHANPSQSSPSSADADRAARWRLLGERGHPINPCNSPLHPAVSEAGIMPDPRQPELCLQEAYTPESTCYGCGPSAKEGLFLRSKRVENGLEARVRLDRKYESFPGIVNGGIVGTLVDCLSNWTAATHLMDTSAL
jgi:hypothetical protein